jgi:hypothetical protein
MIGRLVFTLVALAVLAGSASAAGDDPREPKKRYNAADQAWARAIRLTRSDLGAGDWRVEPSSDDSNAPPGCRNPDMSDLVLTGKATKPDFSRNGSFVASEGEVWANERDAARSWKRSVRFPFAKCLPAALKQGLGADPSVKLTILSSGPLRVAKLAPRMFSYGMRFRIEGPGGTIQARLSMYAFGRGRADGSLLVASMGPPLQPISPSLEGRLVYLIARRLRR